MSRLIVKNLPNQITDEKLREIFGKQGEITDIQLKYTKEGKFRNFGFIGYKTEEQATAAREYFNGSCIKTSRISVEVCISLGNKNKPKAWSKYAPDSSAYKKINNIVIEKVKKDETHISKKEKKIAAQKQILEILSKHKNDPLFSEFMELHGKNIKNKIWNEELTDITSDEKVIDSEKDVNDDNNESDSDTKTKENEKLAFQKISDFEYMKSLMKNIDEDKNDSNEKNSLGNNSKPSKHSSKTNKKRTLFTVKVKGLPFKCKKKSIKEFFKPLIPFTIRIPKSSTKIVKGFCYVGFRTEEERKKALFKSRTFLDGHRVTVDAYNKSNINETIDDVKNPKFQSQEETLKTEENISESGKLFVRNLPYVITEDEVEELFKKFGPLTECNLPVDKTTHQPKGFAHITYMMPEHAVQAYTELDGSIFCGRMLHILPGKQRDELDENEENLSFKEKKERKQKKESSSSHNWNTLFLGANAVADVVADAYDTTKEKLLEGTTEMSAAVKLALGETHVVANTRKFLEDNGVTLDVFNQPPKKRSKTVILVKNLPAKTISSELQALFVPFGLIARLIMPPCGITALVEFVEPSEARQAFSKLAYTKFKYLPLYLEWAPDNVFNKPPDKPAIGSKLKQTNVDSDEIDDISKTKKLGENVEESDISEDVPEENTVIFVKGLNFETREHELQEHFESCGRIYSVTIAMKNDPRNPGQKLSMGYGFIQFYRKGSAESALKTLQMSMLDGKQIELKRSERAESNDKKTSRKTTQAGKQTGTKILVRNVPFQANRKELQDIFGSFGEIKALRLPKKMTPGENHHRGFCFIEYYNNSDAKNAFTALCQSTHLYGRRLVLEWAKLEDEDEMLKTLRKRTAESYNSIKPGGKKNKKAVADIDDLDENED